MWNPFKSIQTSHERILVQWRNKTPNQKWQTFYNFARTACDSIGIRVLSDMKNTWYTATCGLDGLLYFALVIYAMQYYFKRGDYVRSMECTCVIGIPILDLIMYWNAIGPHRYKLNNLASFGGKYLYKDNKDATEYNMVCEKHIRILVITVLVIVSLMMLSHAMLIIGPLFAYYAQGIRITSIGNLPYLEKDSNLEFVINLSLQAFMALIALVGSLSIEVGQCLIINTITIIPDLIKLNLKEIADELLMKGMSSDTVLCLRNVLIQIQDFDLFVRDMIEVYYMKLFAGPFLCTFSISLSIFAQLILLFPAGYACAICCYVQLLIICYAGNSVKIANESIAMRMYEMPWYSLSTSCQKQVSSAIQQLQNGAVLTIGPLAEIDLNTASELTKNIYKLIMMLFAIFK